MDWKQKEERLNAIWNQAPLLEEKSQFMEALALWREALELKLQLGVTGAGDVGELDGIKERINILVLKTQSNI